MRRRQGPTPVPQQAERAAAELERRLMPCPDLRQQSLVVAGRTAVIVWLEGLVDEQRLQIGLGAFAAGGREAAQPGWWERLGLGQGRATAESRRGPAPGGRSPLLPMRSVRHMEAAVEAVLAGNAVAFLDGEPFATAWDVEKSPGRTIERAENEPTLQGPQEAFTENLGGNLALLRKRLKTPGFKAEPWEFGERSRTQAALLYIEGMTKPELLDTVRRRLEYVHVDAVVDLNVVREYINDAPFSPFPTTEETERPERVVSSLLQGRVGLLIDGSPNCVMVPVTLPMLLNSPEDYYMRFALALPLRLMRHLMFWSAMLLPSLYVALLTYNQDLMPTPLLVSVAAQHTGIPFPTVIEALAMMVAFETLREAGTRLPRAVGQSVSIVGTLIIGDAAVRAGLVSPGMVIVVAATGVASFTLPALGLVQVTRLLQFLFVGVAALMGLYGVMLLAVATVGHLVSIRSFGIPYMSPLAPTVWSDMKDTVVRAPWWAMRQRPRQFEPLDSRRAKGRPGQRQKRWWAR
ncbi:spore germination protein [Alicyclobacillus shizuokensis]|uniref:spore germination protein n=1 Tax=Alicyclobacillus shizuokensis TaxID=392014 RepID=UPI000ADFF27A|nr:spore germination protein [Alicyclobacillus shizuokensis]